MDPPMTPTPGSAAARPPPASHSSSKKRPQRSSDYPPSDNKASHGPMGGRAPETTRAPVSEATPAGETRSDTPPIVVLENPPSPPNARKTAIANVAIGTNHF